jgi:hypothetical protein
VGLFVQSDTADLMLPLVMAMRWATAVGEESSSSSSKTTDAATCICAQGWGPRIDGPCAFPYAPGPKAGEWRDAASVHTWAGLRMPKWRVERRGEAIELTPKERGPSEIPVSKFS